MVENDDGLLDAVLLYEIEQVLYVLEPLLGAGVPADGFGDIAKAVLRQHVGSGDVDVALELTELLQESGLAQTHPPIHRAALRNRLVQLLEHLQLLLTTDEPVHVL